MAWCSVKKESVGVTFELVIKWEHAVEPGSCTYVVLSRTLPSCALSLELNLVTKVVYIFIRIFHKTKSMCFILHSSLLSYIYFGSSSTLLFREFSFTDLSLFHCRLLLTVCRTKQMYVHCSEFCRYDYCSLFKSFTQSKRQTFWVLKTISERRSLNANNKSFSAILSFGETSVSHVICNNKLMNILPDIRSYSDSFNKLLPLAAR